MKSSNIVTVIIIFIMLVLVSLTPFFLFNAYSYNFICLSTNNRSICDYNYVNVYSYIQEKYWNVGKVFKTYYPYHHYYHSCNYRLP